MNVNIKSTFFLIKETIELLRKAGAGASILITSSITGQEPEHHIGLYGMTKSALENMVKWMKDELRDDGIRVNAIAPGMIATEFSSPVRGMINIPESAIGKPE